MHERSHIKGVNKSDYFNNLYFVFDEVTIYIKKL